MGREVKRVPLDFAWPLNKVWQGFLNPYWDEHIDCYACGARGFAPEARLWMDKWCGNAPFEPSETGSTPFSPYDPFIQAIIRPKVERESAFYIQFLLAHDIDHAVFLESVRMCEIWNASWGNHLSQDDVNVLFNEGRLRDFGETCPTATEVNRWSLTGFGHGGSNQYCCVKSRVAEMGLPIECPLCAGHGHIWPSSEIKAKYETWENIEPPTGEGFQLWETVSEGSPISPVFATPEEFENWLIHDQGYSEGAAEQFVQRGWAPSLVIAQGRVYKDIEMHNIAREHEGDTL